MTLRVDCRAEHDDGFVLDVAFEAGPGLTLVRGPSGHGKSTLIDVLAGVRRPTSGRVALGETVLDDVATRTHRPAHRRGFGVVFQEDRLLPHRSVAANLRFGAGRAEGGSVESWPSVAAFELGELLTRSPRTLSGGEARRVAIARALPAARAMLLLDEPWTGLDRARVETVATFVLDHARARGLPVILVTHDESVLPERVDRVIELRDGRVRSVTERVATDGPPVP